MNCKKAIYQTAIFLVMWLIVAGCKDSVKLICDDCNTLTCLVNGKPFIPGSKDGKKSILNATTYGDKKLEINAYNDQEYIGLSLNLADSIRVGRYRLSTYPPGTGLYSAGSVHYSTNGDHTGELTITKLSYGDRPFMEGTFQYQCTNQMAQKNVSISEGTFSVFFGRAQ